MRAVCIDATRLSFCMFVYYHTVTHRHPPLPYTTLFRSLHLEAKRGPVCSTRQTGPEYIGPSNRTNAGTSAVTIHRWLSGGVRRVSAAPTRCSTFSLGSSVN